MNIFKKLFGKKDKEQEAGGADTHPLGYVHIAPPADDAPVILEKPEDLKKPQQHKEMHDTLIAAQVGLQLSRPAFNTVQNMAADAVVQGPADALDMHHEHQNEMKLKRLEQKAAKGDISAEEAFQILQKTNARGSHAHPADMRASVNALHQLQDLNARYETQLEAQHAALIASRHGAPLTDDPLAFQPTPGSHGPVQTEPFKLDAADPVQETLRSGMYFGADAVLPGGRLLHLHTSGQNNDKAMEMPELKKPEKGLLGQMEKLKKAEDAAHMTPQERWAYEEDILNRAADQWKGVKDKALVAELLKEHTTEVQNDNLRLGDIRQTMEGYRMIPAEAYQAPAPLQNAPRSEAGPIKPGKKAALD